jgi:hypothetical protein
MSDVSGAMVAGLSSSDLLGVGLGATGAILVLVGAYLASILINEDPCEIAAGRKLTVIAMLLSGFVLSIAGLSGTLWDEVTEPAPRAAGAVTPAQSFDNLLANARVERLIRLVVRKRDATARDFGEPGALGEEGELYTLVADYDEMRGKTAAGAAKSFGLTVAPGDRIAAIIFPRQPRRITPASALGLLQTVAEAGSEGDALGFSERLQPPQDPCGGDAQVELCRIADPKSQWPAFAPYYGARVFFIKNEPLASLEGRIRIDFDAPDRQRIPDLDLVGVSASK